MTIFGRDLEPAASGSPSKRYRGKVKGIAEQMRPCRNLDRQEVFGASPREGAVGESTGHGAFGNWSSSEENGAPRSREPRAPAPPSPVRFCLRPGCSPARQAPTASPPAAGWNSRIAEVLGIEEMGSLKDPLEGWPRDEQYWPASVGRCAHSDPPFANGVGPTSTQASRSDSDIKTRALTLAGAERVPLEEFRALTELGDTVAVRAGRDFAAWYCSSARCVYRHECRMGVRLGEKAIG